MSLYTLITFKYDTENWKKINLEIDSTFGQYKLLWLYAYHNWAFYFLFLFFYWNWPQCKSWIKMIFVINQLVKSILNSCIIQIIKKYKATRGHHLMFWLNRMRAVTLWAELFWVQAGKTNTWWRTLCHVECLFLRWLPSK